MKLVPVDPPAPLVLGALEGKFSSAGDIVSSPLSDREWKALQREQAAQWERWMKEPVPPRASPHGSADRGHGTRPPHPAGDP